MIESAPKTDDIPLVGKPSEDADDISAEDFKAMKSDHEELLNRIKAVKDKVTC